MSYTKEEIEKRLLNLLEESLRSTAQESSVISLTYDEKTKECSIKLNTHIVEEDDYIGFDGY